MGNCCGKNGALAKKYAVKSELGAPLLKKLLPQIEESALVYIVRLKSINGLQPPAGNLSGLADPFAELKLTPPDAVALDQLQRSSFKPSTLNPKWVPPERFQFCTSNSDLAKIIISVYSYRGHREPLPIGDAVLSLKELNIKVDGEYNHDSRCTNRKLKLIDPSSGKLQGEVDVEIELLTVNEAVSIQDHIIYEYQRWQPVVLWGSTKPGHFFPTDPGKWSADNGKKFGEVIADVAPVIPVGWTVEKQWYTMATENDPDGWTYAKDFNSTWYPSETSASALFVRRRMWKREIVAPANRPSVQNLRRGRKVLDNE